MELKWGIYAPCINEIKLIEPKIKWALRHDMAISICEGHHPHYEGHGVNHLSVDGTSEILKSYSDRINYIPIGAVPNELVLRDTAYKELPKNIDVAIMSDIDEFYTDKDLELIDGMFVKDKNLKLVLTNSYIFLDKEHCAPHVQRNQGDVQFAKDLTIHYGQYHERIFRYNRWYSYRISPFLINDFYGRFLFDNPVYYGERTLLPDVHMLHYKNFKYEEAKKRLEMYDQYADGIKHDDEMEILEKNKIKFFSELHPIEIKELMK